MKAFAFFVSLFCLGFCKKETMSDLYDMLNDPKIMREIEKRLNLVDDDSEPFSDEPVGCYEKSAILAPGCKFTANSSMIIKTKESMEHGAKFLNDFGNITCPRECTTLCCKNPDCDTAVYEDKGDRKCFLFQCGETGACKFDKHNDYWITSISDTPHKSHSYKPGGSAYSHENELENLGSQAKHEDTTPVLVPSTTTTRPTTSLPGLGDYCHSYLSECNDEHAECLMKTCRCRVGYHEKHGVCRKHCSSGEFECENIVYGSNARQCVLNRYVCDGHSDCDDESDEQNCPDKNKQDKKPSQHRPVDTGDKDGVFQNHPDMPKVTVTPSSPHKTTTEKIQEKTTPKPVTPSPTDAVKEVLTEISKGEPPKIDSQASTDTDETDEQEPVSNEQKSGDQSVDESSSIKSDKSNSTEVKGDGNKEFLNILNVDAVEVESYTDNFQGPIVALALGLAITLILLIIVGCRLRTVKRRLRKGRALHSNEADYLINGMYL